MKYLTAAIQNIDNIMQHFSGELSLDDINTPLERMSTNGTLQALFINFLKQELNIDIFDPKYVLMRIPRLIGLDAWETLKLPATISQIDFQVPNAFSAATFKTIDFSEVSSLKRITSSVFGECPEDLDIILPDGLEELGYSAFSVPNITLIAKRGSKAAATLRVALKEYLATTHTPTEEAGKYIEKIKLI